MVEAMTIPESVLACARAVNRKRSELGARHAQLCDLNDELRANGGVAFSVPNAEGMCISYRANPNRNPMGRGFCAADDRDKTTTDPVTKMVRPWATVPAGLTQRIEAAYRAWQEAAGAAESARLLFDAEGQAFLNDVLSKAGSADG